MLPLSAKLRDTKLDRLPPAPRKPDACRGLPPSGVALDNEFLVVELPRELKEPGVVALRGEPEPRDEEKLRCTKFDCPPPGRPVRLWVEPEKDRVLGLRLENEPPPRDEGPLNREPDEPGADNRGVPLPPRENELPPPREIDDPLPPREYDEPPPPPREKEDPPPPPRDIPPPPRPPPPPPPPPPRPPPPRCANAELASSSNSPIIIAAMIRETRNLIAHTLT
jgi:hypothetical protein